MIAVMSAKGIRFTVPGHPLGYYAQGARSLWRMSDTQRDRAIKYRDYCEKVRVFAVQAGVRLPLESTPSKPLYIETIAYFESRVHADPGNVQKGVVDALFKVPSGIRRFVSKNLDGDKYTGGAFDAPRYDAQKPRVEILIRSADFPDFEWEHDDGE